MTYLESIINLFNEEEILEALVSNPKYLNKILAKNPKRNEDFLTRHSEKYQEIVSKARSEVRMAYYDKNHSLIEKLLNSEDTIPEALRCIYEAGDAETKEKVKKHPNCPVHILQE